MFTTISHAVIWSWTFQAKLKISDYTSVMYYKVMKSQNMEATFIEMKSFIFFKKGFYTFLEDFPLKLVVLAKVTLDANKIKRQQVGS